MMTAGPGTYATLAGDVVGGELAVAGVVVKEASDGAAPPHQICFEFSDGTYLELYSDSRMRPTQLWEGGRAEVRSPGGGAHCGRSTARLPLQGYCGAPMYGLGGRRALSVSGAACV